MRTRCPECHSEYPVSVEELRTSRGMLCCRECSAMFDALEFLQEPSADPPAFIDPAIPWAYTPPRVTCDGWSIALWLNLLLLCTQWVSFTAPVWPHQPTLRPLLERFCAAAGCHLPVYHAPQQIELLQTLLQPLTSERYRLHAALFNDAPFPQRWPRLYLTLYDFDGRPYAAREFLPEEYLSTHTTSLLPAQQTVEMTLDLVLSEGVLGGYSVRISGI